MDKTTLILGAGPAGMAAASELCRAGKPFALIEKQAVVGGLSRTLQYGEFRTDIGPHRFFSQNRQLYTWIEDLLGDRWRRVDRLTRFYINNRFFLYPIELRDALSNVGICHANRILLDYAWERLKKLFAVRTLRSFEEQVVSDFGRALAELNMLNYTEKIWGLPCSEISRDWSRQRIKGLSLAEAIKKTVIKSRSGPKTLVEQFYYPDSGTGLIYEEMRERISRSNHNAVSLNSHPVKITCNDKRVTGVTINTGGVYRKMEPEHVISSIPITEYASLLDPAPPRSVIRAFEELRFRSHVSLFIVLDRHSVFPDQWIYFPNREIPFGRMMEPKNFSERMSPAGKTSLLIEFFCWKNDEIWNGDPNELFELGIEWLEDGGFIKRHEVLDFFVHKEEFAYPLYDLDYKKHLTTVTDYLGRFRNLQMIGRAGSFRYNNQDHALEMGLLAAKSIIENKQYNTGQIGLEQEYFER